MAKQSVSGLRHIHLAVGMKMAADELWKELNDPNTPPDRQAGIAIPMSWLYVFGIESGIKALMQDTKGLDVVHIHQLDCLWKKLPDTIQKTVEELVAALCTIQNVKVPNVEGLLRWHRDSFVNWRYGEPTKYEDEQGVSRETGFVAGSTNLRIVLQAIINTHTKLCGDKEAEPATQDSEPQTGGPSLEALRGVYDQQKFVYPDDPESKVTFDEWRKESSLGVGAG